MSRGDRSPIRSTAVPNQKRAQASVISAGRRIDPPEYAEVRLPYLLSLRSLHVGAIVSTDSTRNRCVSGARWPFGPLTPEDEAPLAVPAPVRPFIGAEPGPGPTSLPLLGESRRPEICTCWLTCWRSWLLSPSSTYEFMSADPPGDPLPLVPVADGRAPPASDGDPEPMVAFVKMNRSLVLDPFPVAGDPPPGAEPDVPTAPI
jgi:hypothetical protein